MACKCVTAEPRRNSNSSNSSTPHIQQDSSRADRTQIRERPLLLHQYLASSILDAGWLDPGRHISLRIASHLASAESTSPRISVWVSVCIAFLSHPRSSSRVGHLSIVAGPWTTYLSTHRLSPRLRGINCAENLRLGLRLGRCPLASSILDARWPSEHRGWTLLRASPLIPLPRNQLRRESPSGSLSSLILDPRREVANGAMAGPSGRHIAPCIASHLASAESTAPRISVWVTVSAFRRFLPLGPHAVFEK